MPEISVIMPSIRPHLVQQTIEHFAINNPGVDYELLIASSFPVSGERVVHVKEEKTQGSVIAMTMSYERCRGDYILLWADDYIPSKDCLKNLLAFTKKHQEPFIANCRFKARRGLNAFQFQAYGRMFPIWGCASRRTIDMVGGLMDRAYHMHLCDVDLGLRIWEQGGSVEVCPDAWAIASGGKDEINAENLKKYWTMDAETFLNKWHHKLGGGSPRDLGQVIASVPLGVRDSALFFIYTHCVPVFLKDFLKRQDTRKIKAMFGRTIVC